MDCEAPIHGSVRWGGTGSSETAISGPLVHMRLFESRLVARHAVDCRPEADNNVVLVRRHTGGCTGLQTAGMGTLLTLARDKQPASPILAGPTATIQQARHAYAPNPNPPIMHNGGALSDTWLCRGAHVDDRQPQRRRSASRLVAGTVAGGSSKAMRDTFRKAKGEGVRPASVFRIQPFRSCGRAGVRPSLGTGLALE